MLYHFTSSEATLKILLSDTLLFSKSMNLDDPFERQRSRNYGPFGFMDLPIRSNASYFESLVKLTNLFCFFDSTDSDGNIVNPLTNLKMWSHYGRSHKGCCIVFDKAGIVNRFENCTHEHINYHGKIKYIANQKNYIHKPMSSFDQQDYLLQIFNDLFASFFFTKSDYYRSENEFRLAINTDNNDFFLDISGLVCKVVVAENISKIDLISIHNLCKLKNIEIGRMLISNDELEYFKIVAP